MIISIIFFPNPISIGIAIIGANLPDFDHDVKKINVYKMMIVGLLVFIILYIMNLYVSDLIGLLSIFGIILCIFSIIFYFSNHRGFTHSLLGITVLSVLLSLVMNMEIDLISQILNSLNLSNILLFNIKISFQLIAVICIMIFLAMLIINKRIIVPFLILFLLGIVFFSNGLNGSYMLFNTTFLENNLGSNINFILLNLNYIFFPLFLGLFSHIILDSTTPAGIELFRPFSSKKVHKKFAIISLSLLLFLAIFSYF